MEMRQKDVTYGLAPTSIGSPSSDVDEAETFLHNAPWARTGQRRDRTLAFAIWTNLGLLAVLVILGIATVAFEARRSLRVPDESQYFRSFAPGQRYQLRLLC